MQDCINDYVNYIFMHYHSNIFRCRWHNAQRLAFLFSFKRCIFWFKPLCPHDTTIVWFYGFPAVKSKITSFNQLPALKTYHFNDKSPPNLLLKNGNIRPAVLFQCRLAPPSGGSDMVLMFCVFFFYSFLLFSFLLFFFSFILLFFFFYFIIILLVCGWLLVEMQKLAIVNSASRLCFTLVICWLKFNSL